MSFHLTLERLRDAALEVPKSDKQRGLRENRLVSLKDLRELLRAFDSVDSMARGLEAENRRLRKLNETLEGMKREH